MLCEVMNDMLVIYAMKMLIDVMDTRSIIESCHEMFMQLGFIFLYYVICHVI